MKSSQLIGPITLFQVTEFEEHEIKTLFYDINNLLGDSRLNDKVFDDVFKKWWPDLKENIEKVFSDIGKEMIVTNTRTDRQLLEEILELSRGFSLDRKNRIDLPVYTYKLYEDISEEDKKLMNESIDKILHTLKKEAVKDSSFFDQIFKEMEPLDNIRLASGSPENLKKYIDEYLRSQLPLK